MEPSQVIYLLCVQLMVTASCLLSMKSPAGSFYGLNDSSSSLSCLATATSLAVGELSLPASPLAALHKTCPINQNHTADAGNNDQRQSFALKSV